MTINIFIASLVSITFAIGCVRQEPTSDYDEYELFVYKKQISPDSAIWQCYNVSSDESSNFMNAYLKQHKDRLELMYKACLAVYPETVLYCKKDGQVIKIYILYSNTPSDKSRYNISEDKSLPESEIDRLITFFQKHALCEEKEMRNPCSLNQ